MFQPTVLGIIYHPLFFIRGNLFLSVKEKAHCLKGKLIDLGCGSKPYENLFLVDEYIGVDIKISGHDHGDSKIDVFYDGETLPFSDNEFDSALSSETFEHVPNPERIAQELHRVLKPGGKLLLTVPFVWPEHEMPYDFCRFTAIGIEKILTNSGFKVIDIKRSGTFGEVIVQIIICATLRNIVKLSKFPRRFFALLVAVPLNIVGYLLTRVLARNKDMYFNTVIMVEK